jgi:hypothetical protein
MKTFLVVQLAPYSKAFKKVPVVTLGDMKTAWDRGYVFEASDGSYCSIRDIPRMKSDGIEGIIISHQTGTIQLPFGETI